MIRILLCCLLMMMSSQSFAQTNATKETLHKKIDQYITQGAQNGFSGAVLIAKKGQIILNKGYGFANKEKQQPNTPNTVFSTGSVTKQFTAAAILKLVELNKLKLTDTIGSFFTDIPEDKKNITVHQLLIHASGLVGDIGDGDFDHMSTDKFFNTLFATKLRYAPGTKHRYSNAGYSVLARIVEIVSKQEYEAFLQHYLFKPAGMEYTGYLKPDWNKSALAHGYIRGVTDWGPMIPRFQKAGTIAWGLKGNGGIQSTQEDMYRWYQALRSNTVLSKASTTLLTKPYIQEQEGSDESFYAYGWAIFQSDRNTKIVTHNGSNGIFFHEFMWLPEEDVVIILSTNAYSREVEITWRLEKLLFDASYDPKPIRKSPYVLVLEFIKNNKVDVSPELVKQLKQQYGANFSDANVLNQIGYMLLEKGTQLDWMLALFKLNVELFPNNANLWDSLGDGYKLHKDRKNAIASYKKALTLDPTLSASRNSLTELGVVIEESTPKAITLTSEIIKKYVGTYELASGHVIKINESDGALFVQFPGRTGMKLTPRSQVKFAIGKRSATLSFQIKNKQVTGFIISENGEQMVASRKE